jgi:hypothetical protein
MGFCTEAQGLSAKISMHPECQFNNFPRLKDAGIRMTRLLLSTLINRRFNEMRPTTGMSKTVTASTAIASRASGMCPPVKQPISPSTNHLCGDKTLYSCNAENSHMTDSLENRSQE